MATSTILNPLVIREDQVEALEKILSESSNYSYTTLPSMSDEEVKRLLNKRFEKIVSGSNLNSVGKPMEMFG